MKAADTKCAHGISLRRRCLKCLKGWSAAAERIPNSTNVKGGK